MKQIELHESARFCQRCGVQQVDTPTGRLCSECRRAGEQKRCNRNCKSVKVSTIAVIDALRTDENLTYAEAARNFGVSRERIRQIAKRHLGETGMGRYRDSPRVIQARVATRQRVFQRRRKGRLWLVRCVNRWLAGIGSFYCGSCHGALAIAIQSKGSHGNRCKPCAAKSTREFYQRFKARDPNGYRAWFQENNRKRAARLKAQQASAE